MRKEDITEVVVISLPKLPPQQWNDELLCARRQRWWQRWQAQLALVLTKPSIVWVLLVFALDPIKADTSTSLHPSSAEDAGVSVLSHGPAWTPWTCVIAVSHKGRERLDSSWAFGGGSEWKEKVSCKPWACLLRSHYPTGNIAAFGLTPSESCGTGWAGNWGISVITGSQGMSPPMTTSIIHLENNILLSALPRFLTKQSQSPHVTTLLFSPR